MEAWRGMKVLRVYDGRSYLLRGSQLVNCPSLQLGLICSTGVDLRNSCELMRARLLRPLRLLELQSWRSCGSVPGSFSQSGGIENVEECNWHR